MTEKFSSSLTLGAAHKARAQDESHRWARLYIESPLKADQPIQLDENQAHYLRTVLRQPDGSPVRLFNGKDGDWKARLVLEGKKSAHLLPEFCLRPQSPEPDLWLCAALIKKTHFDYLIEKSTELGISRLQPLLTGRTQVRDFNLKRALLLVKESSEQSERLTLPDLKAPQKLTDCIQSWPEDRLLLFCAESGDALPINEALTTKALRWQGGAALFTGPEGGFEPQELEALRSLKKAVPVRLGPRILRADTAAIAALSCWQSVCGDWAQREQLNETR